ncbi:unnamed protein product [Rotaria sordida]|uniref:Uncharacterized protein n=1 Tax=Rotaria sordida TaxID=392033 RepID=A0A814D1T5_9BILA|nr:unnamed protein product [Rotaria sordida]
MPLSIVESSHHQNNNEVIGTNDSNQCIDLTSIKFNQIDNNQEDKSYSNNVEHNHPPNHHNVKRLLILQKFKERVTTELTSVTRIIDDEYVKNNLNDGDRQHFLLPTAQASTFYEIRAKTLPSNPKSLDFEVPESYSKTYSGEQFLTYDSTHKKLGGRLMIFTTEVLIKMLCSCEVILIDGTFKTRPIMFSQSLILMSMFSLILSH